MAEAVGTRRWDDAAVHRVLDGLLVSELREVEAGDGRAALRAVLGYKLLNPPRGPADRTTARAEVESALRAAPPDRVPALLTVARRHGITPAPSAFTESAYTFARWWLEQDDELMPQRWGAPDEALDWVRDVLHQQLAARGRAAEAAVTVVRDRWWEPLRTTATDPRDPLDTLVWSSLYRTLAWDGQEAGTLRHRLMDTCAAAWPGSDGSTATWNILYRFVTPTLPECRTVVRELRKRALPMSPDVAVNLVRLVDSAPKLTAEGLEIVHAIDEAGHAQRLSRDLAEHRDRDRVVWGVVEDLPASAPRYSEKDLVAAIEEIPAELRRVRMPLLVDALLKAHVDRAAPMLRALKPATFMAFGDALKERWPRAGGPSAKEQGRAAVLVFVVTDRSANKKQGDDFSVLRNLLGRQVTALSKEERAAVFRALPSKAWEDAWTRWLREIDPSVLQKLGKVRMPFRGESGNRKG